MAARETAAAHYQERKDLVDAARAAGRRLWTRVDPGDLGSWLTGVGRLLAILTGAQRAAAEQADRYADAVLGEQGITAAPRGAVVPSALAGIASDGRPLETLLWSPVASARMAIGTGATEERALAVGRSVLDMIVGTQVADAGRVADGIAIVARPEIGYVRMLTPPSCSRCVILAGRFYRWQDGFERHPLCNCEHVPAREDTAGDLRTDPAAYFRSLDPEQQAKVFTAAGARAIRDGADMNQVVNARRGAAGLSKAGGRVTEEEQRLIRGGRGRGRLQRTSVFGQDVLVTSEGTTTRGLAGQRLAQQGGRVVTESAETVTRRTRDGDVQRTVRRRRVQTPRLMPESIYELAKDRAEAVRLLRRFGYIT